MKCPYCGMEIENGLKKCPECFRDLTEEAQKLSEEGGAAAENAPAENKKHGFTGPQKIVFAAVAAVVAIAVIFLFRGGNGENPDSKVATMGDYSLNNRDFNYYYWSDYYSFVNTYNTDGSVFSLSKPLAEQQYDDGTTWQDYFMTTAVNNWRDITVAAAQAQKEGFELPSEYASALNSLESDLNSAAETLKLSGAEEYLQYSYGEYADLESFSEFLKTNYLASSYCDQIYSQLLEQYGSQTVSVPTVNIRHILISFDEFENAEEKANEIYQMVLSDPGDEEFFGDLANEYSSDPGSNTNGGLYKNVYDGMMVESFNDWCMDPQRQYGDTGLVETDYGWHIMFFCGKGDDLEVNDTSEVDKQYNAWLDSLITSEVKTDFSKAELYK